MDENHEKDVETSNDKSEEILEDKNENKDINEESQDVKSDLVSKHLIILNKFSYYDFNFLIFMFFFPIFNIISDFDF